MDVAIYVAGLSSALISAVTSIGLSWWPRRLERKRQDQNDLLKLNHVRFEIVLQLEAFVNRCVDQLNKINDGLSHSAQYLDHSVLSSFKSFYFELNPAQNLNELPIEFVAELKSILLRLESTNKWIATCFDCGINYDDVYALEKQRIAYYGLKILAEATHIRHQIKIVESNEFLTHVEIFNKIIEEKRTLFEEKNRETQLIPELQRQFQEENKKGSRGLPSKW